MEIKVDGFIYQYQNVGGIPRIFTEILPRMCDVDPTLQITIFTSGRCQQVVPTHRGIKHQTLLPVDDLLRPRRLWRPVQQQARKLIQQIAINGSYGDVWHSTYFTEPKNWQGPKVVTVYDMIYERYADLFVSTHDDRFRKQKRSSVLSADKVICISDTTLKDVQNYYDIDIDRLEVIPLAYGQYFQRLEMRNCSHELNDDKPYLLYVGKRDLYKNFKTLLNAYSIWQQRNEVDLLVVGSDWSDQEREWLVDWGLSEQVHLLPGIDDQVLACLYNHAVAFVYPSLYEGFGIPLLEAMACGCPVVASRIPTTVEVAGDQPFYFEAAEADDLLLALDVALSEGRQPARVQSGVRRAQQYTWDKTAKMTLQIYHSLSRI